MPLISPGYLYSPLYQTTRESPEETYADTKRKASDTLKRVERLTS